MRNLFLSWSCRVRSWERDQRETDGERWGASGFGENLVTNAIRQTYSLVWEPPPQLKSSGDRTVFLQADLRGEATRGVPEWFSKWATGGRALLTADRQYQKAMSKGTREGEVEQSGRLMTNSNRQPTSKVVDQQTQISGGKEGEKRRSPW
jgi:hypothetical protein